MKKLFCCLLALCLIISLAPRSVLADDDICIPCMEQRSLDEVERQEQASQEENGEENGEEEYVAAPATLTWIFEGSLPTERDEDWVIVDDVTREGDAVVIGWEAPLDGEFSVTAVYAVWEREFPEDGVLVSMYHGEELLASETITESTFVEFFEGTVVMTAGEFLYFVVDYPDNFVIWGIAIEVEVPAEEGEDANYEEDEPEEVEEEDEEELTIPEPRPIDTVATRTVDGVVFVSFRAAARAYGVEGYLGWDGATRTVSLAAPTVNVSFTVGQHGSFMESWTVYVPFDFAVSVFEQGK